MIYKCQAPTSAKVPRHEVFRVMQEADTLGTYVRTR